MSFLLTVGMPEAFNRGDLTDNQLAKLKEYNARFKIIGMVYNGNKIANLVVNNKYNWPGQLDENGDPMIGTSLHPDWILGGVHEIMRGSDLMKSIAGTPVTVLADTITDTTISHSHRYPRYYVKSVIVDEVITGVILLNRIGNPIVQDNTDPDNLIYIINAVAPELDGSYTKIWTTPGKDVPGVGKVIPEALEANGDYIHTPYNVEVDKYALVERIAIDQAKWINFMPDVVTYDDQGTEISRTRPTVASDIGLYGGYKRVF